MCASVLVLLLAVVVGLLLTGGGKKGATGFMKSARPTGATSAGMMDAWYGPLIPMARSIGITQTFTRICLNSNPFIWAMSIYTAEGAAQYEAADAFYQRQRPLMLETLKTFELHPYWGNLSDAGQSFETLIGARMHDMVVQMSAETSRTGRAHDDFFVEKDKCAMQGFLSRNCLPTPTVYKTWRADTPDAFLADLALGSDGFDMPADAAWPVFLKFCHLTQGPEDSVRRLRTPAWVADNVGGLKDFTLSKWNHKADDSDRWFRKDGNALTGAIPPGACVQAGYADVFELKVQTVWGRAYAAYLNDVPGVITREGMYERGCKTCFLGTALPVDVGEVEELAWLKTEGQLERVWQLADAVAALMGADQLRVDIFMRKGDPAAVMVNEISLNTGQPLHMHAEFAARLWREGWELHSGATAGGETAVHLLDAMRQEAPNRDSYATQLREIGAWNPDGQVERCMAASSSA